MEMKNEYVTPDIQVMEIETEQSILCESSDNNGIGNGDSLDMPVKIGK